MPTSNDRPPRGRRAFRGDSIRKGIHPLVWWVLFLVVMLGAVEVLVEWSDSLADVVQVEQPAGWLIV